MERVNFERGGKILSVAVWEKAENPRGVVQISHGMAEHMGRYDDFATFLNKNGYIVFGDDHRAHGLTDRDTLGFCDGDIFYDTVADACALTSWAAEKWGLPIVFFGHSYGSFIGQQYLIDCSSDIAACVLSGSALYGCMTAKLGKFLAALKCKKHAKDEGTTFANMTFRSYDKKFAECHNAWLSRNLVTAEKYNADLLSGFTCSNGFYNSFFGGMKELATIPFSGIRSDFPLLIIYGTQDPVGDSGKLVKRLVSKYEKYGLKPKVIAYEGARHETLNETNNAEVYSDVLSFINEAVEQ